MLGLCLIIAAVLEYIKEHTALTWFGTIGAAMLMVGMMLFLFFLIGGGGLDGFGLPCATCGKRLSDIEARFAIATGTCCRCGKAAFDQPSSVAKEKEI